LRLWRSGQREDLAVEKLDLEAVEEWVVEELYLQAVDQLDLQAVDQLDLQAVEYLAVELDLEGARAARNRSSSARAGDRAGGQRRQVQREG
jgi:hypothetical protein